MKQYLSTSEIVVAGVVISIVLGMLLSYWVEHEYYKYPCGDNLLSLICEESWDHTRSLVLVASICFGVMSMVLLSLRFAKLETTKV